MVSPLSGSDSYLWYLSVVTIFNMVFWPSPAAARQDSIWTVVKLINWGLVTPFGNIDLGQHWLR